MASEARWLALRGAGVIDADAPNPFEYERHRAAVHAEFTPAERAEIRVRLGMLPAPAPCPECGGSGEVWSRDDHRSVPCPLCGTGQMKEQTDGE